ncbi:MAG: long-chain fatty acid--CoA ligase, partial [Deltaproteobacteria bacterium]|nr:long-chain fatty acid--CoA ligase [Deltaproteobacteria bacterium]
MEKQKLTYDVQMFQDTFENEFTYLNGFLRNVHRFKERTALTCPQRGRSWSYPQVNAACNKLAHALMGDGVERQQIVMYQL